MEANSISKSKIEAVSNGHVRWVSAADLSLLPPPDAMGRTLGRPMSIDGLLLEDDVNGGGTLFATVACQPVSVKKAQWKHNGCFGRSLQWFATAARELNGAIYTVGGYDGEFYLESAERYDPREGYWARLPSMLERRGCLSLAVIDQQLYAVGGFDGVKMVASVEIFDPRFPSWFPGLPMRKPRGYAASAMINDTIYMMAGLSNRGEITETVECFNQRTGWYTSGFKSLGKRCFFSAVAM